MYANPVNDIITLLDHELVQLFITSPARSQLDKLTDSRTDVMVQRTCHVSLLLLHLTGVLICNLFVYNNRIPLKHAHSTRPSQLGLSSLLRNVLILLLKCVSCPEGSLHRKHERKCWVKAGPQTSELQRRVVQLPENVRRLFFQTFLQSLTGWDTPDWSDGIMGRRRSLIFSDWLGEILWFCWLAERW